MAGRCACPTNIVDIRAFGGSVLLSFAQICVICGQFGDKTQIEKESRYAQFNAWPEDCPQRCARNTEKLHRCIRATHSADKMGEIYLRYFSAPDLRRSHSDVFHGVRARDCGPTAVGG
jgi:hypothetical protein